MPESSYGSSHVGSRTCLHSQSVLLLLELSPFGLGFYHSKLKVPPLVHTLLLLPDFLLSQELTGLQGAGPSGLSSPAGRPARHHTLHPTPRSPGPPHLPPPPRHHQTAGCGPCSISRAGWHWAAGAGQEDGCSAHYALMSLHPTVQDGQALTFSSSALREKVMLAVLSKGALGEKAEVISRCVRGCHRVHISFPHWHTATLTTSTPICKSPVPQRPAARNSQLQDWGPTSHQTHTFPAEVHSPAGPSPGP